MPRCGNVRCSKNTADAKIIGSMLLNVIYCNMSNKSSSLYGMLHRATYDVDAMCVNAAMFIVLEYNVATRRM